MLSFTVSGQELFQDLPEPVFWTCREKLAYWNRAAERLCKEAGVPLKEGEALVYSNRDDYAYESLNMLGMEF